MHTDGRQETAPLEAGPDGFCIAKLGGKVVTTEVPNLMVAVAKVKAAMKKPSAAMKKPAAAMKKPAAATPPSDDDDDVDDDAADEEEEEEEEEEAHEEEEEEEEEEEADKEEEAGAADDEDEEAGDAGEGADKMEKRYTKMWYKNYHNFGIRQCFLGKQQVMTVGGARFALSKKALGCLADKVISKLESGEMTEAEGRKWVIEELARDLE